MRDLINLFIEWADAALNWIYNFFKKVWGRIIDWWSTLKNWIQDQLRDSEEVVIVDGSTPLGREIIEEIRKKQPKTNTIDGIERKYAMTVKNDAIDKVSVHDGTPEQEGALERAMEDNDGILRIK